MPRGGTFFMSHRDPFSRTWAHVHSLEGYKSLSPISCGGGGRTDSGPMLREILGK
jgi:hypothetical protein